jgi:lactate permease
MLGWLGVFLTGSDTSSNALFGNLQEIAAARKEMYGRKTGNRPRK